MIPCVLSRPWKRSDRLYCSVESQRDTGRPDNFVGKENCHVGTELGSFTLGGLAPAVALHASSERCSAVALLVAIAQPAPGVPGFGSIAIAQHSRRNVPTSWHCAAALGAGL